MKGSPFEYEFLIEVVAPGPGAALDEAIAALRAGCRSVRELGRYAPAG